MAISLGRLRIDSARGYALVGERVVLLRPLELRLLTLFARRPDAVLRREEIADALWGPDATVGPRAIDQSIARLRRALNGAGHAIVTVRRVGYRIDPTLLSEDAT